MNKAVVGIIAGVVAIGVTIGVTVKTCKEIKKEERRKEHKMENLRRLKKVADQYAEEQLMKEELTWTITKM